MKNIIFVLVLISTISIHSQSFDFQYDHYSMIVEDLSTTGDFYKEILGLKEIPHPSNAEGFRWFSIHGNSQLHLIKKETVEHSSSKSVHLCLATKDLQKFIAHLKRKNITFWDWPGTKNTITNRADGVQQIYVQDPEENWVEINTAQHK